MDLSKAFQLIREFEGLRLRAYPDPATGGDPWTIGYGTTRINGQPVAPGSVCTLAEAESYMETDATSMANKIKSWIHVPCTDNMISAMISLAYNIGIMGLYHSSILSQVNEGDKEAAAHGFRLYVHAAGRVLPGLVHRRQVEAQVFLS